LKYRIAVRQNNGKYTYSFKPKTRAQDGSTLLLHHKIQFAFIIMIEKILAFRTFTLNHFIQCVWSYSQLI